MRLATLTYAICLLLGALGAIALTIYAQNPFSIGTSIFLFLCAAIFFWGQRRPQEPTKSSGDGARPRTKSRRKPARSPRQWGFILHGAGTGLALAMLLLITFAAYVQDTMFPYEAFMLLGVGMMLIAAGMLFFVADGVGRSTEQR